MRDFHFIGWSVNSLPSSRVPKLGHTTLCCSFSSPVAFPSFTFTLGNTKTRQLHTSVPMFMLISQPEMPSTHPLSGSFLLILQDLALCDIPSHPTHTSVCSCEPTNSTTLCYPQWERLYGKFMACPFHTPLDQKCLKDRLYGITFCLLSAYP